MQKTIARLGVLVGALAAAACSADPNQPDGGIGGGNGSGTGASYPDGGAALELNLAISPARDNHGISPLIYGINGAAAAAGTGATVVRLGGNLMQPYNWEINATNGGRILGYANQPLTNATAPGAAVSDVIAAAAANHATALITLPFGDYVAGDTKPGNVYKSGSGYLGTRFKKNNASNPLKPQSTPDTSDGSVYQDEFALWVKGNAGDTPTLLAFDNQPELWFQDHPEIHPKQVTYDEIVTRTLTYAKAIKAVWPDVNLTGYASYGWEGFVNLQMAPDAAGKGEFVDYYLEKLSAAESSGGVRLLDYLDLHWWPEARGNNVRIIEANATPAVAAARVQAPRSLWDDTYHETSWINDSLGGATIDLIPRMQASISKNYPGTKLAFSAWYYGGGADISGAIATADVLGIFGREGIDLAAVELPGGDDSYTMAAFRAFLNFDGMGGRFGDVSIEATTTDPVGSSVYASKESSDPKRLVILVLNKQLESRVVNLTIAGDIKYASCTVFTLTSAKPSIETDPPLKANGSNSFRYSMPALSVSILAPQP